MATLIHQQNPLNLEEGENVELPVLWHDTVIDAFDIDGVMLLHIMP